MKKLLAALLCLLCLASAAAAEDVTVILDYVPNTNHTGMYAALYLGYYEEAGLNVNIIEPTEGATAALVAVGRGDFGISYQEEVTMARASEEPLPIRAVAAVIQHNTSGFATFEGKNITSPADFEGKVYSSWGGPGEEATLRAVMDAAGADFSKLDIVVSDGAGFASLARDVDVMWFYEAWDNVTCQLAGFPIRYMELRELDERLDYYTPVIITSETMIKENPETVRKFLAATAKGYQYAIEHPDDAAVILHGYAPDYDLEMLTISQSILADEYQADAPRWGEMKTEVWDNYTGLLVEYGVLPAALPADTLYTNEFLPEAVE